MESITIAAPVFNEELNISDCIETWVNILNELAISDYEIILCDDKSTDNSVMIIEEHIKKNNKIKIIKHRNNQGAAKAVISAGDNASKNRILFVDSDGQFPASSIKEIIIASNAYPTKCIFGARNTKEDSILTKIGTKITTLICNLTYQKKFSDISCILKIIPNKIYKNLNLESTGLNVSTEMTCKILETETEIFEQKVLHRKRIFGTSSAAGFRFIKHAIKRITILKYFILRRILIHLNIISPKKL